MPAVVILMSQRRGVLILSALALIRSIDPGVAAQQTSLVEQGHAHRRRGELVEQGHAHRRRGELVEAIASYYSAIKADPDDGVAHMALGNGLFAAGDYPRAIRSFAVAAALDPADDQPHVSLCNAFRMTGEFDGAVEACHVALKLNPNRHITHINLGNALQSRGDLDQAVRAYTSALELNPSDHVTYTNLGSALLADRRLVPAIRAYEKAIQLQPSFALAHTNLGNARKALGDLRGAVESYFRALELDPRDHVALNNMGTAVAASGRPHEAHEWYVRALAARPDFEPAQRNLAKSPASETYAEAALAERLLLRQRAHAAEAAGAGRYSASGQLQLAFEGLRELEVAGAESPLWSGRALEMPEVIAGLLDGAQGGPSPITLGAFAWGGVWASSLFRAFAARPVRAAIHKAQRTGGEAVVLGSSIGFEAIFVALAFGLPTTGVELLPGLVELSRRCRAVLGIRNVAFVTADALEWPLPARTAIVYVDDTAWDASTVEAVARKLALELRPGAVVLHNVKGPYEAMGEAYDEGIAVPVSTSWDGAHHILVHTRI